MKHRFLFSLLSLIAVAAQGQVVDPYPVSIAQVEAKRVRLAALHARAQSSADRSRILIAARNTAFDSIVTDLFPPWIGTTWDFYGTSQIPGKGKIACGYFVSTILRDAGFKVERVRLAQQASEKIITTLTTEKHIQRYRNKSLIAFVDSIERWGKGFYVVGLDFHVGFILHDDKGIHFVHSAMGEPGRVLWEDARKSPILAASKYRVVGKISADETLLRSWLAGEAIRVK